MFNQHDIGANFRMAMETVDRIRVDWGNSHQPNIVLLLGPMPAEQRRSLLSGGRRPRADGEIPIVQTELRRIGYECAFIGEWNLSEDDSKHRDFERWIVTRADTAWESPTLMVERALIHYSTPLLPLLSEFASHYVGQDHARPYFLTVSYPSKPGAGPLLPESADALLRQLEAGEPTLIVRVEFDEPEDRMRYTLRPAARAAADFTRLSSNAALLPTLRKAVGLSPLPDLPGRPLESDAAAGSSSDR
jgi:hypothetical protein